MTTPTTTKATTSQGVVICSVNICLNGGLCLNSNGVTQCICVNSFTGIRCETSLATTASTTKAIITAAVNFLTLNLSIQTN